MDFDILPPVQYQGIWLTIFFIALGALVLYVLLVLLFTRKKKQQTARQLDVNSQEYKETIRRKHMTNIEALRASTLTGELSAADLNQRLGVILRSFAAEYSGMNTRPMTLSELKRNNIPSDLISAIEAFYPIAFRNLSQKGDPNVAVQAALDVIYRWN